MCSRGSCDAHDHSYKHENVPDGDEDPEIAKMEHGLANLVA